MDAASWDRRYSASGFVWTTAPNVFLAAEVDGLVPGTALDLACGEGRNAVWLATQGWQATGVDFSAVGLDKARQLADSAGVADRCVWVVADAVAWEPRHTFDLVVVLYLHLPAAQRRAAMAVAAGALAPGGTLLVVGHDSDNLTEGVGGPPDPTVLYGPDDLVADLVDADASLVVERAEQVRRAVTVANGPEAGTVREAIDCLVRARRPGG